jgi:hypothetical protein
MLDHLRQFGAHVKGPRGFLKSRSQLKGQSRHLRTKQIKKVSQSPYWLDIAPGDFYLFGVLKQKLDGSTILDEHDLMAIYRPLRRVS